MHSYKMGVALMKEKNNLSFECLLEMRFKEEDSVLKRIYKCALIV